MPTPMSKATLYAIRDDGYLVEFAVFEDARLSAPAIWAELGRGQARAGAGQGDPDAMDELARGARALNVSDATTLAATVDFATFHTADLGTVADHIDAFASAHPGPSHVSGMATALRELAAEAPVEGWLGACFDHTSCCPDLRDQALQWVKLSSAPRIASQAAGPTASRVRGLFALAVTALCIVGCDDGGRRALVDIECSESECAGRWDGSALRSTVQTEELILSVPEFDPADAWECTASPDVDICVGDGHARGCFRFAHGWAVAVAPACAGLDGWLDVGNGMIARTL